MASFSNLATTLLSHFYQRPSFSPRSNPSQQRPSQPLPDVTPATSPSLFRRIPAPPEKSTPVRSPLEDLRPPRSSPLTLCGGANPSGPIVHPPYVPPEELASIPITFASSPAFEAPSPTTPAPATVEQETAPLTLDASGAGPVAALSSLHSEPCLPSSGVFFSHQRVDSLSPAPHPALDCPLVAVAGSAGPSKKSLRQSLCGIPPDPKLENNHVRFQGLSTNRLCALALLHSSRCTLLTDTGQQEPRMEDATSVVTIWHTSVDGSLANKRTHLPHASRQPPYLDAASAIPELARPSGVVPLDLASFTPVHARGSFENLPRHFLLAHDPVSKAFWCGYQLSNRLPHVDKGFHLAAPWAIWLLPVSPEQP